MMEFKVKSGELEDLQWRKGDLGDAIEYTRQVWTMTRQGGQTPLMRHGSEHMRAVRVVEHGRLGFATSRTEGWDNLLKDARISSQNGLKTAMQFGQIPSGYTEIPQSQWDEQKIPRMGAVVEEIYTFLEKFSSEFRPTVSVSFHEALTECRNTTGGRANWLRGYWEVSAGGREVDGIDFHSVSGIRISQEQIPSTSSLAEELRERFEWGKKLRTIENGRYPVIFLPPVAMALLEPVLARLSGPALIAGNSPWENQQGTQVLSALLSLVSDAQLQNGPRTAPFDDEGTPTQTCSLISQGILQDFILDRDSASRLQHTPKGFGYRNTLQSPIQSLPSTVVITPGSAKFDELLRRYPRLLVLNGWIGGRATNPMRGDIAGNASDLYLVEAGEVVGRVKHAVISVNAFDALGEQLREVGADAQWIAQGMMQGAPGYIPPLLIDGVDVAVKE